MSSSTYRDLEIAKKLNLIRLRIMFFSNTPFKISRSTPDKDSNPAPHAYYIEGRDWGFSISFNLNTSKIDRINWGKLRKRSTFYPELGWFFYPELGWFRDGLHSLRPEGIAPNLEALIRNICSLVNGDTGSVLWGKE